MKTTKQHGGGGNRTRGRSASQAGSRAGGTTGGTKARAAVVGAAAGRSALLAALGIAEAALRCPDLDDDHRRKALAAVRGVLEAAEANAAEFVDAAEGRR